MIYPYAVKHDGVWYSAGQDISNRQSTIISASAQRESATIQVRKRGRPPKQKEVKGE